MKEGMMKYIINICLILSVLVSYGWAEQDTGLMEKNQVMSQNKILASNAAEKTALMIKTMQQLKFKNQTMVKAKKMVMAAKDEGLPVEPVVNKALEGMAKRVSEDAIIKAMEKTQARYAYAYKKMNQFKLSEEKDKDVADSVADCMAAGLAEKDMDKIMDQLRARLRDSQNTDDQDLVEQSVLLTRTMARMGVPSDVSGDVVCEALKNQFLAQDMEKMQIRFKDQARTQTPAMVANQYAKALKNGAGAQEMTQAKYAMGSGGGPSDSGGASSGGSNMNGSGVGPTAGPMGSGSSGSGHSSGSGGSHGGRSN